MADVINLTTRQPQQPQPPRLSAVLAEMPRMLAQIDRRVASGDAAQVACARMELAALRAYFAELEV